MTDLKASIDPEKVPRHVAVIMDGNGRWAKVKGKPRIFGHRNAIEAVRDTVEGSVELGVEYLTLYAFSTENWNRPRLEVTALMELLVSTIRKEVKTLNKNEVRLLAVGNLESLPKKCYRELMDAIDITAENKKMTLVLALSYSSRWEIVDAAKKLARAAKDGSLDPESIDDSVFSNHLTTAGMPDPELMIRTSGESRISNFLLWQLAYAELHFTSTLWPDFRREDLQRAVLDFQSRERRFGKTSEQVQQ